METLVFETQNKSAIIQLEDLDRTIKLEEAGGSLPPSAPIHHSTLIKQIMEISHKHLTKFNPKTGNITIKQNNCKRIMWKGEASECPITNYLVERLVMKVGYVGSKSFEDVPDAKGSMAVGISYTEKGIQMAFGHNVNVCQNLNVFGDTVFSTYGSGKVPFEKGMQLFESWIQNFDEHMESNRRAITTLRERVVTEDERLKVFGKIYEMAILKNEGADIDAPLNVTECNKMVANGFASITAKDKTISAWDLTNWATSVLKPESSDMMNLLAKNNKLNNFLLSEFGAN